MSKEILHLLRPWEEPSFWKFLIKLNKRHRAQLEYAHKIHPQYKSERDEAFAIAGKFGELLNAKFDELLAAREAVGQIAPDLADALDVRGPVEIGSPIDRARAIRRLARKLKPRLDAELANAGASTPARTQSGEGGKLDVKSAKQLLHGWRAIDEALGLSRSYPNMGYGERRRKLARLNDYYSGPIKIGKKGSQPIVNRSELIAWWNSLEDQVEAQKARIRDKQATLQNLRPYGRTAQVAPDIDGSVKRRKSRSQT